MAKKSMKLIAGPLLAVTLSGLTIVDPCDGKHVPFEIGNIRKADVVFGGTLVGYQSITSKDRLATNTYGLLTVRVTDRIKGAVPDEVTLYWRNSPRGAPDALPRREPVLIAAIKNKPGSGPAPGITVPLRLPEPLSVMQKPCSLPFILHYSASNAANIRAILRGEATPPHDYFRTGEMEREQKAAIAAEKTMLSDARRLDKEARADELTRTRRDWWMRAGLALAGLAALVWLAIVPLKRR
jgi:hypothetical protein